MTLAERLGTETVVDLRLSDGHRVLASISEDRIFEPGQTIGLDLDQEKAHLFAPATEQEIEMAQNAT